MAEIPTEALEAAARARTEHVIDIRSGGYRWCGAHCTCGWDTDMGKRSMEETAELGWAHVDTAVFAAAAPHLIAEGRRQAAREIAAELDAMVGDDHAGTLISQVEAVEIANRIAEGGTDG